MIVIFYIYIYIYVRSFQVPIGLSIAVINPIQPRLKS